LANVLQRPGEPRRRWFHSEHADLIVWYTGNESIKGFQLCYDRLGNERALTWMQEKGFSHLKVDDGEIEPLRAKRTPILVADGVFDAKAVLERFLSMANNLPVEVATFVTNKLREYPVASSPPLPSARR
jgi:hypothetical protein